MGFRPDDRLARIRPSVTPQPTRFSPGKPEATIAGAGRAHLAWIRAHGRSGMEAVALVSHGIEASKLPRARVVCIWPDRVAPRD
jgi:hypothetical protein